MSNRKRTELFQSLLHEIRRFIASAVLFNQQLADKLGVNATDYQVLNLLDLRGDATPGKLAQLTGLTTGGITVALDRLEKAGFIKRERNPNDRRSLIIHAVPAKMRQIFPFYKPVIEVMDQVISVYDDRQLGTLVGFFQRANNSRNTATRSSR
jgi:MarR family transcriptional regulator, organic hydroperoxide resistance regulator